MKRVVVGWLVAIALVAVPAATLRADESPAGTPRPALLALLDQVAEGLTARKLEGLSGLFEPETLVITPDLVVCHGFEEFQAAVTGAFEGESAWLRSARVRPDSEFSIREIGDDRLLIDGTSEDVLQFETGELRVIEHRYSALLRVQEDGIVLEHVQVAANFRDNPLLNLYKDMNLYASIGGVVFGLVFGAWATSRFGHLFGDDEDPGEGLEPVPEDPRDDEPA